MLKEVEFGQEAITYIRSCLSHGNTLSAHLLNLPLEDGQVVAYLPPGVEASTRFEVGGVMTRAETEPKLAALISAYLSKQGRRYVVFEDALSRPSDPYLLSSQARFFTYKGSEVYHFLTSQESDTKTVTESIRRVASYLFIGILTVIVDIPDIRAGQEATLDVLQLLAQNTENIVIGAYDGEGVLVWGKH